MSSSFSSSSRCASSSQRRWASPRRSPVRYRVGPLDYEPTMPCWCKEKPKAAMWISWSDDNPGRRYKTCAKSRMGGCEMYEWHDDPIEEPFLKQLIIDLCDRVRQLERISSELRDAASSVPQHQTPQLEVAPAPTDNLALNQGSGYMKAFAMFVLLAAFCYKLGATIL
ncbi:uncharacterized protein LOC125530636 [Triticum urartu]|uniref:uncharacterized protein LOC125523141 n=1 Tax=Triticum urartu TaxID=4572 RepID=UPI002043AC23|nr:uncharacterized protein LOC125523141 [Triticum urartu]XP_048550977.1 uncharacterized protein LOC125530636 [Triticum urartu]